MAQCHAVDSHLTGNSLNWQSRNFVVNFYFQLTSTFGGEAAQVTQLTWQVLYSHLTGNFGGEAAKIAVLQVDLYRYYMYCCRHVNQSTDLVALRAGSVESGEKTFRFPSFLIVLDARNGFYG